MKTLMGQGGRIELISSLLLPNNMQNIGKYRVVKSYNSLISCVERTKCRPCICIISKLDKIIC